MVIIFWELVMFYEIFLSPQVEQSAILSNKHGIYELPHELPNDLRLTIKEIRECQEDLKTLLHCSLMPSLTPKITILSTLPKNCWK